MFLITATLVHSFRISPNFRAFSLMMSSNPPGGRTRGSIADILIIRCIQEQILLWTTGVSSIQPSDTFIIKSREAIQSP